MSADLYSNLKTELNNAMRTLQSEGFLGENIDFSHIVLEQPKDSSHGDFATNAAMVLAKAAKRNPREIAEKIVAQMQGNAGIEKATIAGPGFINFKIKQKDFNAQIQHIIAEGKGYGDSSIGADKKVMVEFVSANPTGPMHFGHGRGAVVGDVLAELLKKAGFAVHREYLINDAGGQMRVITKSVHVRYLQLFGMDIELPENCYPGEYVIDIAQVLKERDGEKWLDATDDETIFLALREFCVEQCMSLIKTDLAKLEVNFDSFFSEYSMHQSGAMTQAIANLRQQNLIYEGTLPPPKGKEIADYQPEKLTLFRSADFGDDVDRAVYKSNGEPTYFGQDIAYHNDKLERGFDLLVNIWGADHGGAVKRLTAALEALTGKKNTLKFLLVQMVRLMRNGEPLKMSKRAGNFVTLSEVLDEVGGDAVRFIMLMRKSDAQFDFDLAKAVEKNNENPVFYVQYAHARMCSIFRQQAEMGIADLAHNKLSHNKLSHNELSHNELLRNELPDDDSKTVDLSLLILPEEREFLRTLIMYPLAIEKAAIALEPHRMAFYAYELAGKFHSWYNAERFLLEDNLPLTHARLELVKAGQAVLQNVLGLLGVTAPERM